MEKFSEFARLLDYAPKLFGLLLHRQNRDDSEELRLKIIAYFRNINRQDEFEYRMSNSLPSKRVLRLATLSALDHNDIRLPLAIYDEYASGRFHTDNPTLRYSEEEVRFTLTAGGNIPMEWWFLISGEFRLWNPRDGELHFVYTLDGDPLMDRAKADYL